ncbi:MAG: terpene cyclase/mutase family protein [Planctomycetales bacterium]|nr:terpene cyclase/mutase family protein [Planctomycetales bacterium]
MRSFFVSKRIVLAMLVVVAALSANRLRAEPPEPETRRVEHREGPIPEPAAPVDREQLDAAIKRGVDFLLRDQNENGSWGSATRTKGLNIYAPVPGAHHAFRDATTSLCVSALIESQDDRREVREAIDRGEAFLLENLPSLRRATGDAIYNVWGHAFSLQALARLHALRAGDSERQKQIVAAAQQQVDLLGRYASVDGGWGYYDFRYQTKQPSSSSISFTSATGIIALFEAREIGVEVPQSLLDKAVAAIQRQRKPDNSYAYGEYLKMRPMLGINRPGGSLGRSQACNLALRRAGDDTISEDVLRVWLNRLFARNGWLSIGRKRPIPHESHFQVAGYFYYYGHFYAALCIDELPESDRPPFRDLMAQTLLPLQEKDGSWWDYPLYAYHQPYGTSFAVMSLVRCRP